MVFEGMPAAPVIRRKLRQPLEVFIVETVHFQTGFRRNIPGEAEQYQIDAFLLKKLHQFIQSADHIVINHIMHGNTAAEAALPAQFK
ncbi:hypothetical protein D3C85_1709990 [compost metagenome]